MEPKGFMGTVRWGLHNHPAVAASFALSTVGFAWSLYLFRNYLNNKEAYHQNRLHYTVKRRSDVSDPTKPLYN